MKEKTEFYVGIGLILLGLLVVLIAFFIIYSSLTKCQSPYQELNGVCFCGNREDKYNATVCLEPNTNRQEYHNQKVLNSHCYDCDGCKTNYCCDLTVLQGYILKEQEPICLEEKEDYINCTKIPHDYENLFYCQKELVCTKTSTNLIELFDAGKCEVEKYECERQSIMDKTLFLEDLQGEEELKERIEGCIKKAEDFGWTKEECIKSWNKNCKPITISCGETEWTRR